MADDIWTAKTRWRFVCIECNQLYVRNGWQQRITRCRVCKERVHHYCTSPKAASYVLPHTMRIKEQAQAYAYVRVCSRCRNGKSL